MPGVGEICLGVWCLGRVYARCKEDLHRGLGCLGRVYTRCRGYLRRGLQCLAL